MPDPFNIVVNAVAQAIGQPPPRPSPGTQSPSVPLTQPRRRTSRINDVADLMHPQDQRPIFCTNCQGIGYTISYDASRLAYDIDLCDVCDLFPETVWGKRTKDTTQFILQRILATHESSAVTRDWANLMRIGGTGATMPERVYQDSLKEWGNKLPLPSTYGRLRLAGFFDRATFADHSIERIYIRAVGGTAKTFVGCPCINGYAVVTHMFYVPAVWATSQLVNPAKHTRFYFEQASNPITPPVPEIVLEAAEQNLTKVYDHLDAASEPIPCRRLSIRQRLPLMFAQ